MVTRIHSPSFLTVVLLEHCEAEINAYVLNTLAKISVVDLRLLFILLSVETILMILRCHQLQVKYHKFRRMVSTNSEES